jgi:hypothetical protein
MPHRTVFRVSLFAIAATIGVIATGPFGGRVHAGVSLLLAVALVALAVLRRDRLSFLSLGLFVVSGGLARLMKLSPWAAVGHEVLAPALLSLVCFIAVEAWPGTDLMVEDSGKPSVWALARITPPAILLQVFMGALYRHAITNVALHVVGAMFVGALIMFAGISVMILPGVGKALQRVSGALLGVTVLQFMLGIYAYVSRITAEENGVVAGVSHVAVSHIVTGGLTMGLSVVLSLIVNRYVRPAEAVAA